MALVKKIEECKICHGVATGYYFSNHSSIHECWRCGSRVHVFFGLDGELETKFKQGYGVAYLCLCNQGVYDEPIRIYAPITEKTIEKFKALVEERGASKETSFLAKWENGELKVLVGRIPVGGWSNRITEEYATLLPLQPEINYK